MARACRNWVETTVFVLVCDVVSKSLADEISSKCEGAMPCMHWAESNLIVSSIYDKYSIGPSIRLVCTRCCFNVTNMIQVCSNFHRDPAYIIDTLPDEIALIMPFSILTHDPIDPLVLYHPSQNPSFRALSGRLKLTVRRHKFNKDSVHLKPRDA